MNSWEFLKGGVTGVLLADSYTTLSFYFLNVKYPKLRELIEVFRKRHNKMCNSGMFRKYFISGHHYSRVVNCRLMSTIRPTYFDHCFETVR